MLYVLRCNYGSRCMNKYYLNGMPIPVLLDPFWSACTIKYCNRWTLVLSKWDYSYLGSSIVNMLLYAIVFGLQKGLKSTEIGVPSNVVEKATEWFFQYHCSLSKQQDENRSSKMDKGVLARKTSSRISCCLLYRTEKACHYHNLRPFPCLYRTMIKTYGRCILFQTFSQQFPSTMRHTTTLSEPILLWLSVLLSLCSLEWPRKIQAKPRHRPYRSAVDGTTRMDILYCHRQDSDWLWARTGW